MVTELRLYRFRSIQLFCIVSRHVTIQISEFFAILYSQRFLRYTDFAVFSYSV